MNFSKLLWWQAQTYVLECTLILQNISARIFWHKDKLDIITLKIGKSIYFNFTWNFQPSFKGSQNENVELAVSSYLSWTTFW